MSKSLDITIFKNIEINNHEECESSASDCKSIHRIITGLIYYQLLKKNKTIESPNEDDVYNGESIFSDFISENYREYLNDMIHLKSLHENDLESIHNLLLNNTQFKKCDINNCTLTGRHCEITDGKNSDTNALKKKIGSLGAFHIQQWDSMHYHLVHIYEMGLRLKKEKGNNDKQILDKDKWGLVDHAMNKQSEKIMVKRQEFSQFFGRFNGKLNKFTIQAVDKLDTSNNKFYSSKNVETVMDDIYEYMNETPGISNDQISQFNKYIKTEEYDTESLRDDVETGQDRESSNILKFMCLSSQSVFANTLIQYVKYRILRNSSFSCGFTFFYWTAYNDNWFGRVEGTTYKPRDLYIANGKYDSIKDEILSNTDNEVDAQIWKDEVVVKADNFIKTEKGKSLKITNLIRYNISVRDTLPESISLQHLQSLILYTDYSTLSTSFTATFRKKYDAESLKSVMKRNQNYWWMSKALVECVQYYGYTTRSATSEVLYCGMNVPLNMPNANIYLRGPTSTSSELIVAQNFCKNQGVILQLIGNRQCRFNASWISRYTEESERLFIHGMVDPMILMSIRIPINGKWENYQSFFNVLWLLDKTCSGETIYYDYPTTDKDPEILDALISMKEDVPNYVRNCFDLWRNNVTELTICFRNLMEMSNYTRKLPNYIRKLVLVDDIKKVQYIKGEHMDWNVNSNQNLIDTKFVKLFNNVNKIFIKSNDGNGKFAWPYSIPKLIESMMKMWKRHPIRFELYEFENGPNEGMTWIKNAFEGLSNDITEEGIYDRSSIVMINERKIKLELYHGYRLNFEC